MWAAAVSVQIGTEQESMPYLCCGCCCMHDAAAEHVSCTANFQGVIGTEAPSVHCAFISIAGQHVLHAPLRSIIPIYPALRSGMTCWMQCVGSVSDWSSAGVRTKIQQIPSVSRRSAVTGCLFQLELRHIHYLVPLFREFPSGNVIACTEHPPGYTLHLSLLSTLLHIEDLHSYPPLAPL